jgi:hypothetical protein
MATEKSNSLALEATFCQFGDEFRHGVNPDLCHLSSVAEQTRPTSNDCRFGKSICALFWI